MADVFPIDPVIYEQVISDVLDTVAEMKLSGDYNNETLDEIVWRLS